MPDSVNDIILEEVRGLRTEVRDGFSETRQRLTAVESLTQPFFETDGGKQQMDKKIDDLNRTKYVTLGGAGILTTLGHYLLHWWGGK